MYEQKEPALTCPRCGAATKLVVKVNRSMGQPFLGCPNYPNCNHTQPIPEAWLMEFLKQPKLEI